jgi:hypothetical protein
MPDRGRLAHRQNEPIARVEMPFVEGHANISWRSGTLGWQGTAKRG